MGVCVGVGVGEDTLMTCSISAASLLKVKKGILAQIF